MRIVHTLVGWFLSFYLWVYITLSDHQTQGVLTQVFLLGSVQLQTNGKVFLINSNNVHSFVETDPCDKCCEVVVL